MNDIFMQWNHNYKKKSNPTTMLNFKETDVKIPIEHRDSSPRKFQSDRFHGSGEAEEQ